MGYQGDEFFPFGCLPRRDGDDTRSSKIFKLKVPDLSWLLVATHTSKVEPKSRQRQGKTENSLFIMIRW